MFTNRQISPVNWNELLHGEDDAGRRMQTGSVTGIANRICNCDVFHRSKCIVLIDTNDVGTYRPVAERETAYRQLVQRV